MPGVSNARFVSDAMLETITGTTSQVSGAISVDLTNPSAATGNISIDASSLRTGIDMRDQHLVGEDWLNAAEYPTIDFALASVTAPEGAVLVHGETIEVTVTGTLSIRGESKEVTAPASVSFYEISDPAVAAAYGIENNLVRVQTSFDIDLGDYGLSIPPMLTAKVSNYIQLTVRVTAQQG